MLSNPAESVRQLSAAIQHFSIAEPAEIPRLRLLEGEAYTIGADESRAAGAFLDGAKTFEDRLRKLSADQQRVAYSDEGWEIYRQLVELRIHQGALDEALILSDRARSRATDDAETKTSMPRLRGLVDASQRIVFYTVLQRETHAWVFGPQGVEHHTIPIGELQLEQMVSQAERWIVGRHGPTALDPLLTTMYATLIAPLDLPETAREVIFVPDGPLRLAPFAALRDRTGHYLVERWAVVVAHSLESLTRTLEHQRDHHDRRGVRALVVGDPKFDTARSAQLPRSAVCRARGKRRLAAVPEPRSARRRRRDPRAAAGAAAHGGRVSFRRARDRERRVSRSIAAPSDASWQGQRRSASARPADLAPQTGIDRHPVGVPDRSRPRAACRRHPVAGARVSRRRRERRSRRLLGRRRSRHLAAHDDVPPTLVAR